MAYIGVQPKAGQYRKLDDISAGFNGLTTTFTTAVNNVSVTAGAATQLLVSLGGVIQQPNVDYTVSTNSITFTTAPTAGLSFFAILMGDAINVGTPADGSVTTVKLANNSVTTAKLDSSGIAPVLTSVNGGPLSGVRNRIINGDMRIAQRGSVSFSTNTLTYGGCDRWLTEIAGFSTRSGTIRQSGSLGGTSSTNSSGFVQEVQLTSTGSGTVSFQQYIEAQNCNDLNGKQITVSFTLYQDTGSSIIPAIQILRPGALDNWGAILAVTSKTNLSSLPSGVNTRYSFTTTLGASSASNGLGVYFEFPVGAVTNKYFQIMDVQLEVGPIATPFERRSYGQELALCQRYYYGYGVEMRYAARNNGANRVLTYAYPVPMRALPTITYGANTGFTPTVGPSTVSQAATGHQVEATAPLATDQGGIASMTVSAEL